MQNENKDILNGLLDFLSQSPTPYHAVKVMGDALLSAGFVKLNESEKWTLQTNQGYFLTRNDSSIIAFRYVPELMLSQGLTMLGAHTDSPCLKVKPNPEKTNQGYFQLGVETYGGVLLNPWFDRDLSLAGKVNYLDKEDCLQSCIIDFKAPIAVIPSLAIHLNREANSGNKINPQTQLPPVIMQVDTNENIEFRDLLHQQLIDRDINNCKKILDYDLSFYDVQAAARIGLKQEFISSARLDNLLSCYINLQTILAAEENKPVLIVCNDHEEVGSASACGAQGPMLDQCLQRITPDAETRHRIIDRSLMISIDNAHGIHPNYSNMHDGNHGPILNKGPVIKVNANQRYATNSETSSIFKHACDGAGVPVQTFVTRTDLACGSTIGPITATEIGVKTIDVGLPTFAMHSIRELAGAKDADMLFKVLSHYIANR